MEKIFLLRSTTGRRTGVRTMTGLDGAALSFINCVTVSVPRPPLSRARCCLSRRARSHTQAHLRLRASATLLQPFKGSRTGDSMEMVVKCKPVDES